MIAWIATIILAGTVCWAENAEAWQRFEQKSPVDDSQTVRLATAATATYQNRDGSTGHAALHLLCEENRTGIVISLTEVWVSDIAGRNRVVLRVDKNPAFQVEMIASNDHDSLAQLGGAAIATIKKMFGGQTLFVRLLPVNEPAIDITFPIAGISEEIAPLRQNCDW